MHSFPLLRTTACVLALTFSLWTCGCAVTKYVATDNFAECQDKPIKMLTPGGSEYHFRTWSLGDSSIATSEGEVHHPSTKSGFWGKRFDTFTGAVPIDSIKQCFCEETDVGWTIAAYASLGVFVVLPYLGALYYSTN
jgi:hypothetical protein